MIDDTRTDEELAQAAQQGDTDAFALLVERHQRRVFGFLVRVTRDPSRAEDLAQETFLRAWRGLRTFDATARLSPWLYRIAMNLASDAHAVERRQAQACGSAVEDARDPAAGPEEVAGARQVAEAVRAQIDELPPEMRRAVMLRHMMGLSYSEMADVTGLPMGTVKTQLFRARARLKSFFDSLARSPCTAGKP